MDKQVSSYETIAAFVTLSIILFLIFDALYILYIGLGIGLSTLLFRSLAALFNKAWMYVSKWLNYIISRVLLSIVFFLILTPIAILYRLVGKDSLQKTQSDEDSYFEERNYQFKPEDFKKTW